MKNIHPCHPWQVKKIYAIANAMGLVNPRDAPDELHLLVQAITGRESVKTLGYSEANKVIAELERLQGSTPVKPKNHPERPGGPTEGQQRKVWALMYELKRLDQEPVDTPLGDRLCGVIKKELKVDSIPEKPFAWLNQELANKLIEILKAYIRNAKKKAGDADGLPGQDHTG